MARKLSFRSLVLWVLALWEDLSHKEIEVRAGLPEKSLTKHLRRKKEDEDKWTKDDLFERILRAIGPLPGAVHIVTGCLESLDALEDETSDLMRAEREQVELAVLEAQPILRSAFTEAALVSRSAPVLDRYPQPHEVAPARWHAGLLWSLLKDLPEAQQTAVVSLGKDFWSWALVERFCDESEVQASRNLDRAAALARVAQVIAERVQGPEGWCNRVKGFAAAHPPNVLRVRGDLNGAQAGLQEASRLWEAGYDPDGILDPGRLLDLEASLFRDLRKFDKALERLERALSVGRSKARYLIKKGFTLEVKGEYQSAMAALLEAKRVVDQKSDPRLWYMVRFNLGVVLTHLGHHFEATSLAEEVSELVTERGDEIESARVVWLRGRIAAGLHHKADALSLLEQAQREFSARAMWYDVALALLEITVLLLDEGRTTEVKERARALTKIFDASGVHREALAALQLFLEAVEREAATAALARSILQYLFRARHDHGLKFES